MKSRTAATREEWDKVVSQLPGAHVLQSWEWGECKTRYGWSVERRFWERGDSEIAAAAQILRRTIRIGPVSAAVFYLPKGPLLDWRDGAVRDFVLSDLENTARREHAVQLKIDPDLLTGRYVLDSGESSSDAKGEETLHLLRRRKWRFSGEQVQFRNTVLLDIRPEEDVLLANMKQKTRYNIRLAQKRGVEVRPGSEEDLPALARMYAETADRDSFVIRSEKYYLDVWRAMLQAELAQPLIAEVDGLPVSALILFHFADRGWYFYGMSRAFHREKMPNHLLQWEAIRWLRSHGYAYYDFWGAPDAFVESDPMWGVFQFKTGFGGEVLRYAGAWDYPAAPLLYGAYHLLLPRMLDVTRIFSRRRTRLMANSTRGLS
ncbi:MAG: peptidoglycan bridge formation glycyltransferase FemA/FemB family protein [Anaerolineales bacterium]